VIGGRIVEKEPIAAWWKQEKKREAELLRPGVGFAAGGMYCPPRRGVPSGGKNEMVKKDPEKY